MVSITKIISHDTSYFHYKGYLKTGIKSKLIKKINYDVIYYHKFIK
jgi:hypothetical protein